jgi:hypothetical protein
MYTKLVRYDQWHFSEVDTVRLRRMAIRLRDEINSKVKKDDDPYCFYSLTMPIIDAAIRGEIIESMDGDETEYISQNFSHDQGEGSLPEEYDGEFTRAVAGFDVTVQGLSLENSEHVIIDGVTYGQVNFEEEGDWPDRVRFR